MWTVEFHAAAFAERAALAPDLRARLARMADVIEAHGPERLPRDWSKPLGGALWELRLTGRDGIARAIYVTRRGRRLVIVRIFVKKSQKAPRHEIDLAARRAKEIP